MINYDNSGVRRQERLLDQESAHILLHSGEYGVLSMVECRDGAAAGYAIPINYVWDGGEYIYFHCAPAGHKIECMKQSQAVSFVVVGDTHIIPHKFTTSYQSVVVRGCLVGELLPQERMQALKLLLQKYSPDDMQTGIKYAEKSFHRTEILRLQIESISGKAKSIGI